jgi:hypothetical protein
VAADERHDVLVDGAREHHLDDLHGGVVGDAQPVDEARLHPGLLEHRGDLRPAAVHHHHVDADVLQQADVLGEALLELRRHHGVPAVLDHERTPLEAPDERHRLQQHPGLLDSGFHARLLRDS